MKESSGWLLLHSLLVSRPIRCITKGKLRNQHRKTPRLSPPSLLLPPPPLSDLQMLDAAVKNNRAHFSFTYLPTNTSEELLSGASICARGGFFQLEKVAATPVSLLGSFPTQQSAVWCFGPGLLTAWQNALLLLCVHPHRLRLTGRRWECWVSCVFAPGEVW